MGKYRHHRFHLKSSLNLKSEQEYVVIIGQEAIAFNLKHANCYVELPEEKLSEIKKRGKNFTVIFLYIKDILTEYFQGLKDELSGYGCEIREPRFSVSTRKGETFEVAAARTAEAYLKSFS